VPCICCANLEFCLFVPMACMCSLFRKLNVRPVFVRRIGVDIHCTSTDIPHLNCICLMFCLLILVGVLLC
jgi:hypothetical protein